MFLYYYVGVYLALGGDLCARLVSGVAWLRSLRWGGRLDYYCNLCADWVRDCRLGGQIVRVCCDFLCDAFCDFGRFRMGCDFIAD